MKRIGVISDTHGLVRPEALACLKGCALIVHAGDIGSAAVIPALERIGPVQAVRGNVDRGAWAKAFPERQVVETHGHRIYLLHNLAELDFDPASSGFSAVVYGHSHRPKAEDIDGVLYVNPGSAGPRRFSLPVAVATLRVSRAALSAEIHQLNV